MVGVLLTALDGPGGQPTQRSFRFYYRLSTTERVPAGARVSVWIPLPSDTPAQRVTDLQVRTSMRVSESHDPQYGNRVLRLDGVGGVLDLQAEVVIEATRLRVRRQPESGGCIVMTAPEAALLRPFLEDGGPSESGGTRVRATAREIAGQYACMVDRARAVYDYVRGSVRYDKSGGGWGRGDAARACDVHSGDCTDFHALFVALCRAVDVPARFVMGVPLPREIREGRVSGHHCWAEFFLPGQGWIPVDVSEAAKDPERADELFGGLDASRLEFTVGRDLRLPGATDRVDLFIHPYAERDGRPDPRWRDVFGFQEL